MKTCKFFLLVMLSALASAGCGSSSDVVDDDEVVHVAGLWRGTLTLDEDPCSLAHFGNAFNIIHSATQFGSSVEVRDQEDMIYVGRIVGDNGFSVDAPVDDTAAYSISYRIRYDNINGDDDRTADVKFMIIRDCANGSCETSYRGEAIRP